MTHFDYLVVQPITYQGIKLGPRARKCVFVGFKKGVKGYKIWDPKDKKIILSRDITFDEASMVKSTDSQQVKSEKTNGISHQVESILLHHLQIE